MGLSIVLPREFCGRGGRLRERRGATVRALFRAGNPAGKGKPAPTSFTRLNGGWFRAANRAPDVPRDAAVLSEEDEHRYVAALERNGFFGPDSWYMNWQANLAYAERAKANWRLNMPVLFLHGAYDYVCETLVSRLAEPMRAHCENLTEVTVPSGHWMAQEKPVEVNAALAKWISLAVSDAVGGVDVTIESLVRILNAAVIKLASSLHRSTRRLRRQPSRR